MTTIPQRIKAGLVKFMPVIMIKPIPSLAPTSSAASTVVQAMLNEICIPAKMAGNDAGKTTSMISCLRLAPNIFMASFSYSSTSRIPL